MVILELRLEESEADKQLTVIISLDPEEPLESRYVRLLLRHLSVGRPLKNRQKHFSDCCLVTYWTHQLPVALYQTYSSYRPPPPSSLPLTHGDCHCSDGKLVNSATVSVTAIVYPAGNILGHQCIFVHAVTHKERKALQFAWLLKRYHRITLLLAIVKVLFLSERVNDCILKIDLLIQLCYKFDLFI